MTKKCIDCNVDKSLDMFTKKKSCKDGYEIRCKQCRTIRYNKSSIEKVVKIRYNTQTINSIKRGHTPPNYTEHELLLWVKTQPHWAQLYNDWKQSNYDKWLAPSIDRIDINKPYSLDNIELMTWKDNQQNHANDAYTGQESARLRPIRALNKDGTLYKEYYSMALAVRELDAHYHAMTQVADGKPVVDSKGYTYTPKTHKGYIWQWV